LFIVYLFVPSLTRDLVAPQYVSIELFEYFRVFVIMMFIVCRAFVARKEVQFELNFSYFYLQSFFNHTKSNKIDTFFKYTQIKMKENFRSIWAYISQVFSSMLIPLLCLLIMYQRLSYIPMATTMHELDFRFLISQNSTFNEYGKQIAATTKNPFDMTTFQKISEELLGKGMFSGEFYASVFGFLLFWFFTTWFLITALSLFYFRRYKEGPIAAELDVASA